VESKINLTASRNSFFGILQFEEIWTHFSVKHSIARLIGILVNSDITSKDIKQNSLFKTLSFKELYKSKLLPM